MITTEKIPSPTSVALGFFDGVHLGHRAIINKAKEYECDNIKSVIYTLDTHPSVLLGNPTPLISPGNIRIRLLNEFETDYIYLQKTDKVFLNISPEDFVDKILIGQLGATHIVSGENYTFGKNKSGNSDLLKKLCAEKGINYTIVPYTKDGQDIISSSLIRNKLDSGDIPGANRMLGRNYSISGKVIHCREVGTTLGFPTANILPEQSAQLPLSGVYATNTIVDGVSHPSITNVGPAPTFSENKLIIESHILDFSDDIYSKEITIEFLSLIRTQKKFNSKEELIKQLNKDTDIRRKI